MFRIAWRTKSLRFWLTFGVTLAVLPLALSTVVGSVLISRGVLAPFADVAARQRDQVVPAYRLRSTITEVVIPVDEFVDDGDPTRPPAYRVLRERIEAAFADLHTHLARDPAARILLERSRDAWTAADRVATEAISVRRTGGDPRGAELMQRFHGLIAAAVDTLSAVSTELERDLVLDHERALRFYERAEWLTAVAAALSLFAMIGGIVTIGRIVSSSVDRLVAGAERFAAGDREHRIDIQVPPELRSVAEEFNRMIVRIDESEAVLADLAHRDGLTHLPNRRAFDVALLELVARQQRLGEAGSLLMVDIDHFKHINDTHGHAAGDDVLRAVARTMIADVRLIDHVFRIGGEEFAVILAGTNAAAAHMVGERIRLAVAAELFGVRGDIPVTVSVGVAMADVGCAPHTIVEAADAALYRAKTEGRNRIIVSPPHPAHSSQPARVGVVS